MGKLIGFYITLIIVLVILAYSMATITNLVAPAPHSINTVRTLHISLEEASTAKTLAEAELIEAQAATIQTDRIINSVNESVWMVGKFIGVSLFSVMGLLLFSKFLNILRNNNSET